MKRPGIIFLLAATLLFISARAQVNTIVFEQVTASLRDSDLVYFDKGRIKFQQESYLEAIPFFEKVLQTNGGLSPLNYLTGICYSYDVNYPEKALYYIYKAGNNAAKANGYYFNLAYALEKNDSIQKAIEKYKTALSVEEKNNNKKLAAEINYRIGRCKKIMEYKTRKNPVKITNIGRPVNSESSEYSPLINSSESMLIYTYRGPRSKGGKQVLKNGNSETPEVELFFEDIFMSTKVNDTSWSVPSPVNNLNTILHDAAVALNPEGTQLFVYRNNGSGKGDLFLSTFNNNTFGKPVFQVGLNSNEWEGSACFIPYQDKIIFASERKGGYGGKDLYLAERIKGNVWGNIKNLGPLINSKYDEDAPFVTTDGKILFFSSNNNNSMGGYDVFRSDLKNTVWQKPYNLGPPINTKNDDKFFIVRADGKVGYYSTYMQGGNGDYDIYRVEPGIPGMPVEMLQLNGFVTIDGKPAPANIEIRSSLRQHRFNAKIRSDKNTGTFITSLPAGNKYEVIVKTDKFPQRLIELNTLGIDSFMILNVFADFNSAGYDKKLSELEKNNDLPGKDLSAKLAFETVYGNFKKEELRFKVQIGAYRLYENFNYNNVLGFPMIIRKTDDDYITRFVMGNYETYNEAQELLNRIRESNTLKDAFIIAYYKDQKKYLDQLLNEKIVEQ